MTLSPANTFSAGVVLLVVVTIAYGGIFLLRVVTGAVPVNDLQKSFFRAGHAHAGVLVILGLIVMILTSTAGVPGWSTALSSGVLWAAILMPAGFFLSVLGKDPKKPSKMIALLWVGVASLTVGLVSAGTGLVIAGAG